MKMMFLPVPGDKDGVILSKKQARARAIRGLKAGMPAAAIIRAQEAIWPGGDAPPQETGGVPEGIDPIDWGYLSPEEQQKYIEGP